MTDFIKPLLSRLGTDVVMQLLLAVAVGYVVAVAISGVDFWMVVAVLSIPVFAWHGVVKPYRDKVIRERANAIEQNKRREQLRKRAISQALVAVEDAYKMATTRTLDGVINPPFTGEHYDVLMYARNTTDAVASLIASPPEPVGEAASAEHLQEWLIVLRDAVRER